MTLNIIHRSGIFDVLAPSTAMPIKFYRMIAKIKMYSLEKRIKMYLLEKKEMMIIFFSVFVALSAFNYHKYVLVSFLASQQILDRNSVIQFYNM